MDLGEQLRNLFPDHKPEKENKPSRPQAQIWLQEAPLICKYEKRKGKPIALIEGYTGSDSDFKTLTRLLKNRFSTGGSYKNEVILIQGDFRDKIMKALQDMGFKVKRVGG